MRRDAPLPLDLEFSPLHSVRKLFYALLATELAFVVLDTTVNYRQWADSRSIRRMFNIAREDSIANFAGSVQALAVAGVVFLIYLHARRTGVRPGSWAFVAVFFAYLGVDDGAKIHERVGSATEVWFEFFPSYTWQIVYVPILALSILFTLGVIWRETDERLLRGLSLAAPACWAVGVLLDFLDGREGTEERLADSLGVSIDDFSHYSKVIEEFLEMFGTTLFLVVFLRMLAERTDRVAVAIRER